MSAAKTRTRDARRAPAASRAPEIPIAAVLGSYLVPIVILFGGFLASNGTLYGSDTYPMGYMARSLYQTMWTKFHAFPLWNPYILGGLPFVDALHGDIFYPTTILKFLMPLHRGIGLVLILHVYLAGVFMFLCLRGEGLSRLASWFGGLAYMAGPYLISLILAGHDGKIYVTTLLPLLYWLLRRAERNGRPASYLLFGLGVGLLILTAHVQMAYFSLWALGLQFLTHAWSLRSEPRRAVRHVAGFLAALAVGVAIGAVQLYPSYVYTSRYGPRAGGLSYETSTSWSLHAEEIVSLLLPDFGGYQDGAVDRYWGRNPFKLNSESPGTIPVVLALAFLLFAKGERKRFHAFLLGGALVYALGANTPLFHLFYAVVPGVKLFRAPSIIAFLAHFVVVLLAARAVERWIVGRGAGPDEARRAAFLAAGAGAFFLLVILAGPALLSVWSAIDPALTEAKRRAFEANAGPLRLGAALGIGACALVAWMLVARSKGAAAAVAAVAALGAATFLLDARTDKAFIRVAPLEAYIRRDPTIDFLAAKRGDPFRVVATNYPANYLPIFEIESPQGFHDNRIRTFDELVVKDPAALGRHGMLDLLNVRYIVSERPIGQPFQEVFHDAGSAVYENPSVLPRAFLARRHEVLGADAALARMRERGWDPRTGLLLEEAPDPSIDPNGSDAGDRAAIASYAPNRIVIRSTAGSPALLFVSNNYLPYWRATVDGKPAKLLRADYSFQAVPVPAGEHEVALAFRSGPFERARVVTLFGIAAALAAVVWEVLLRLPSRRGGGPAAAEQPAT